MKVTATSPIEVTFKRKGGCIITCRLDFWIPTDSDWESAGSLIFQDVTAKSETQSITLDKDSYTVVAKYYVEESVNGVYEFDVLVANQTVASKSGDVNTTSSQHDSVTFKNQFIVEVE